MSDLVAKTPMDRKLADIVSPEIEALGYQLVRLRFQTGKRPVLQLMVDRPQGGIEVEECAKISTTVSAILDVDDPIEGEYVLEVSSPGIDRPLTRLQDFDEWQGWDAKLVLENAIDNQKRFRGEIAGVEGHEVLLNTDHGTIGLDFDWISDAKLVLSDELLRESLRKGGDQASALNEDQFDEIVQVAKEEEN